MVPWAGCFRGSGVMGIGFLSRVELAVIRLVWQLGQLFLSVTAYTWPGISASFVSSG